MNMINKDNVFELAKHHFLLGVNCIMEERWSEAEMELRRSLEYMPGRVSTLTNLCATLIGLKKFEEAEILIDETLKLDSDNPELILNRGILFSEEKKFEQALNRYEEAIRLKPDYAVAWNNRGVVLRELHRFDEALASYERALEIDQNYAEAHAHRGNILRSLRRYEEAIVSYDRAIQLRPNYAGAHYSKGQLQLQMHNYSEGFRNYLWRWKSDSFPCAHPMTSVPHCEPGVSYRSLLLWAEQGIGDEVFYSRMLFQALDTFQEITLSADRRLHTIFKRSFPKIEIIDREATASVVPDLGLSAQAPIGNLGYILGLDRNKILDTRRPFLIPDDGRASNLNLDRSIAGDKIICGLSWKSANKEFGKEKSINLVQLASVLKSSELFFVNLQHGDIDAELQYANEVGDTRIYQEPNLDLFNDIEGLLALVHACDIVVTTSCFTAHLAGAIGKTGCVFVPFQKGKLWYWHINDTFSFWYPTLRVFYQETPFDWDGPVRQATEWIRSLPK
jgi:tetratricopeptide (TPR) repeat protein